MKMWSSFEIRVPTFNTLFIKMEFLTSGSKTSRTPTLGTEIFLSHLLMVNYFHCKKKNIVMWSSLVYQILSSKENKL